MSAEHVHSNSNCNNELLLETLSNTSNLEKTHYFSLEDAINKPRSLSHVKTVDHFCKRLLHKHKTFPFTRVNVEPYQQVNRKVSDFIIFLRKSFLCPLGFLDGRLRLPG